MTDRTPPNPSGLCQCGCGQTTPIAQYTASRKSIYKGEHVRYIPGHQRTITVPEGTRWCMGCRAPRPVDSFSHKGSQGAGRCRACVNQRNRTPEQRYSTKNTLLRYHYGISIEDYEEMLVRQKGVCAICKHPEVQKHQNGAVKRLTVDHCHETSKVRGLLCSACNRLLGNAEDNVERLQAAIRYLRKFKE